MLYQLSIFMECYRLLYSSYAGHPTATTYLTRIYFGFSKNFRSTIPSLDLGIILWNLFATLIAYGLKFGVKTSGLW